LRWGLVAVAKKRSRPKQLREHPLICREESPPRFARHFPKPEERDGRVEIEGVTEEQAMKILLGAPHHDRELDAARRAGTTLSLTGRGGLEGQ
jgi:hypothetical protein